MSAPDETVVDTPRSLIVTVYGLYARETDGWLGVAAVIRLLAPCGVPAPAVRQAIFRLKRRGLLVSRKVGTSAGYALSAEATSILAEGDRRIFERRRAVLGEGWILAVFSIPEAERQRRHQLRSRLSWLGFGTVAAGVWVAPAHLLEETRAALTRAGLDGYVTLFQAHHVGFGELVDKVPQWWDLDRLEGLYTGFLARCVPLLETYHRGAHRDPERMFADHLTMLTGWRRLPYLDPGLPTELLPDDWPGVRAAQAFFALHETLSGPARDYAGTLLRAGRDQ